MSLINLSAIVGIFERRVPKRDQKHILIPFVEFPPELNEQILFQTPVWSLENACNINKASSDLCSDPGFWHKKAKIDGNISKEDFYATSKDPKDRYYETMYIQGEFFPNILDYVDFYAFTTQKVFDLPFKTLLKLMKVEILDENFEKYVDDFVDKLHVKIEESKHMNPLTKIKDRMILKAKAYLALGKVDIFMKKFHELVDEYPFENLGENFYEAAVQSKDPDMIEKMMKPFTNYSSDLLFQDKDDKYMDVMNSMITVASKSSNFKLFTELVEELHGEDVLEVIQSIGMMLGESGDPDFILKVKNHYKELAIRDGMDDSYVQEFNMEIYRGLIIGKHYDVLEEFYFMKGVDIDYYLLITAIDQRDIRAFRLVTKYLPLQKIEDMDVIYPISSSRHRTDLLEYCINEGEPVFVNAVLKETDAKILPYHLERIDHIIERSENEEHELIKQILEGEMRNMS